MNYSVRKRLKKSFVVMIFLSVFFRIFLSDFPAGAEILKADDLNSYLETSYRTLNVPGGAAILMDGSETRFFFYGENGQNPVDKKTPFLIGSLSKSMTALGIYKLIDEGKINEDSKVIDLIPEFADNNPLTAGITVKELLSHTSGISSDSGYRYMNLSLTGKESVSRALQSVKRLPVGQKNFEESNLNYLILGGIAEKISGLDYESFMREKIFIPLGMTGTFAGKEDAKSAGMVKGFRSFLGILYRSQLLYDDSGSPYGYITSNAEDMEKYMRYLLSRSGAPLISDDLKKVFLSPVYTKDFRNNYGSGFYMINPGTSETELLSDTFSGDYNGQIDIMPQKQEALALFVNKGHALDTAGLETLRDRLKKALAGEVPQPISKRYPVIEGSIFAAALISVIAFLFRYSRRKRQRDYAFVDYFIAVIQILSGFLIFPLVRIFLGYPLKIIGYLVPEIALSLFVLCVFLIFHGLFTFYKSLITDKGRKILPSSFIPPFIKRRKPEIYSEETDNNDGRDKRVSISEELYMEDVSHPGTSQSSDKNEEHSENTAEVSHNRVSKDNTSDSVEYEKITIKEDISEGVDDFTLTPDNYVYSLDPNDKKNEDPHFISADFFNELPRQEPPLEDISLSEKTDRNENEELSFPEENEIIRKLREKFSDDSREI